jgi:hypothetical protein
MLCLPAVLLRDGVVCEDCVGKLPWRGVVHRCYRGSRWACAALGTSLALHRRAGSFDRVGTFLAVSDFVREKHISGFDPDRSWCSPTSSAHERRSGPASTSCSWAGCPTRRGWIGCCPSGARRTGKADRGRRRGGSVTVSASWRVATSSSAGPSIRRVSAGLLGRARALVLAVDLLRVAHPEQWLEAFAAGVPVIANALGGLPGVVREGSGLRVSPGDPRGWVDAGEPSARRRHGAVLLGARSSP